MDSFFLTALILTALIAARLMRVLVPLWRPPLRFTRTALCNEMLTKYEIHRFYQLHCPDCGGKLIEGPNGGGLTANYLCDNECCGSRFNHMGLFGVERITDASPNTLPKRVQHTDGPYR